MTLKCPISAVCLPPLKTAMQRLRTFSHANASDSTLAHYGHPRYPAPSSVLDAELRLPFRCQRCEGDLAADELADRIALTGRRVDHAAMYLDEPAPTP